jgi:hydroxyethylthiazole kinase-like uncharacterized protein yjeF
MSNRSEPVTRESLRDWGLPEPGTSKKTRGRIMVVGGSRRSPGAVLLAGEASLRVGAGRLGLVVPASIEGQLGIVLPEAAVFSLPPHASDAVGEPARSELRSADAVLVGPGFDNADETRATLLSVAAVLTERGDGHGDARDLDDEANGDRENGCLVLDAFALGVLPDIARESLPASLILNPNEEEAAILLGRDLSDDRVADVCEIARRFDAVVNCYGTVATQDGDSWQISEGGAGLGTSGSGDVLAGAIAGFAARGLGPDRAAVWGSWTHARAGDRLTGRLGLGFLARELPAELTAAIAEVSA